MENYLTIILRIVEVTAPLVVALVSVYLSNRLIAYRVDELEKKFEKLDTKVEKHNNFVERIVKLEGSEAAQWKWIDQLKKL